MRRKSAISVVILIVLLFVSGCSEKVEKSVPATTVEEEKAFQIGIAFDSFFIERWERDRDVLVSTVKDLGAEVNVQNANGSVDEQIAQIQYFIDKNVDVIVVIAVDSNSLSPVIAKAKKAGIKVMAYDRLINNANVDLYISFDNEEVGRLMAQHMIDSMPPKSNIIAINGPTKDNNVLLVTKGFTETMAKSDIKIVDSINASAWRGEEAFNYLNTFDSDLFQIQGVMCGNDSLAGQAIRALSERRLAGKVIVVGQDADLEACQRIAEGTQSMTVYKPIEKLAKKAGECAVALAKDQEIIDAKRFESGNDQIPYIKIEPIGVTKDNLDEVIINGGFHLREDVYLNVPSKKTPVIYND